MTPAKGHDVGYIRVSSFSQNTDRQLNCIKLDKTFEEKASAKDAKRPVLQECLDYLRAGDCLHVHSIDRLARNLMDLQKIVHSLNENDVSITFHKENLIFSGSDENPMNKLMLQMMGAFAEFERALIRERQREGIAKAKQMGKQIGRKRVLNDDQVAEIQTRITGGGQLNPFWLKSMVSVGKHFIQHWQVDYPQLTLPLFAFSTVTVQNLTFPYFHKRENQ